MPAKSLRKVQKQIRKKKGQGPALHKNSRDFKRLQSAQLRDQRLAAAAVVSINEQQFISQRVTYFYEKVEEFQSENQGQAVPEATAHQWIQEHLQDNEDALSEAKKARRAGRPASAQQERLTQLRDKEHKEYISGFWLPDLQDPKNIETLLEFQGDTAFLNTVKFCRLTKDGHKRASTYPPHHDV